MAIVEAEIKIILYLGILLFFALYNVKEGVFKNILTTMYLPLSIALLLHSKDTFYSDGLFELYGYVGLAMLLYWGYILVEKNLPEAKQKEKNRLLGGRMK